MLRLLYPRPCMFPVLLAGSLLGLSSCGPQLPEDIAVAYESLPDKLDYNFHVKPVLSDKCFVCHGPDKNTREAGLRLDLPEAALGSLPENPGKRAIVPRKWRASEVYYRILSDDPDYRMPTPESHLSLTAREKAVILKWIKEGAGYKPHWAFVKPEKIDPPRIGDPARAVNAIDHFILDKLDRENLNPSPRAGKELLLRRLSLDLTGLPPTLPELDGFLNDTSPDAYEKQVDRLLASPHFGEHMAVHWLDLARFADSHGYTVDRVRDMSPYRDWVIGAFNSNMPYDRFLHWQLAGDLLPEPTRETIIATAFNRNHQQNMEGGIVEEEFQTEYVADRTNTFGDAFLGITLSCAKCHDHKYDPITQKNYYELFSFFNNVREAGQISWNNALPTPTLLLPTAEQERIIAYLKSEVSRQEKEIGRLREAEQQAFNAWLDAEAYRGLSGEKRPRNGLQAYFGFEQENLHNAVNRLEQGQMKREGGRPGGVPRFESGPEGGKALLLDGDVWLDLGETGAFRKSEPFSIGLWAYIPEDLNEGVVFHKTIAERLYNFRGYHVYLKNNRLEISMAHTAPSNAITRISREEVPRGQWVHLAISYDGSSGAAGFRLYLNGREAATDVVVDQLTKDILLGFNPEPGLQIGAWERGFGLKGGKVSGIAVYNRELTAFEMAVLAGKATWQEIASKDRGQLSSREVEELKAYYLAAVSKDLEQARKELIRKRTLLADSTETVKELMVMQEMPERKRTYIRERGVYNALGEEVFPTTPASILAFPEDLPPDRYGLAQWLTHEDHPLTARVAVNRYWQQFFGTGLVETSGDFGNQGALPSHPELLDWLAVTFRESGWDVKAIVKMMVMSATYRQDSRAQPGLLERDPDNRLLARGPSERMSAEMIRDNALAASGLINPEIGGESIKPYQPEGLWAINSSHYVPDTGRAVYRRSLYVLVKRTVPNPTLASFDAPARTACVVKRQETNTPLQALVTLNDPTFVEAARVMGEQIAAVENTEEAVIAAFRKLTGRVPLPGELSLLTGLLKEQEQKFSADPFKARGWLNVGQYRIREEADPARVAAGAVVANTIMNSDACLTKR
ncbi:MAG: DUF1553 domain-containing protein [Solitalea sp.]